MSIVTKLTIRHLMENRKRTIVTILGIAASTALISAILLGVFSFFKFFGTISVQTDGYGHASFKEITEDQFNALKADSRIETAGVTDKDPEISGVRLDSGMEDRLRVGNIVHGDRDYLTQMVVSKYDGTLPANSSEIAVEEQFLRDNGLTLQIGDELSFEQGSRYSFDEDGEITYWAGNYRSEEKFAVQSIETCTITAILHDNRPTTGYDILRGIDEGYFPAGKDTEVRICLRKCDHTAIKQIVFAFEGSGGSYRALFVLMAIALAVVIATSVILIVNALGMSLTEKMRYLGMLASVGATGRQKRFSIYSEGLILGSIGIPLGLLLGLIGTKITLTILGSRILEADIIQGAEGMRGSIPIVCSPWVILAIVVFSVATILISTWVPARKAARIMPIDALRQTYAVKYKARKLRINPLVRRIFGYEGELAYKNIKRNGAKGAVITGTIAVSVIMFLTVSYFCDAIKRVNQFDFDLPFQVEASCSLKESEKLRETLTRMDGVERVFSGAMIEFRFEKKADQKYTTANADIADPAFLTPEYEKLHVAEMVLVLIDELQMTCPKRGISAEHCAASF